MRESKGGVRPQRVSHLFTAIAIALLCTAVPHALHAQKIKPATPPDTQIQTARPDDQAEQELRTGTALNRAGAFQQALPHLKLAQGRVRETYAASFNLALAYLGTGDSTASIQTLKELQASGTNTAAINNLLAQNYIALGQATPALAALQAAARQTPRDEALYAYIADACTDHADYALGIRAVDLGLKLLPGSARLHYERAIFLARLDRLEEAMPEFARVLQIAPGTDLAYLARVQQATYSYDIASAIQIARQAIQSGHRDYQMLALLGALLLQSGAVAGEPEFAEAQSALEASVAAHPAFSTAQLALGKLCLMQHSPREAAAHLEIAERLEPRNPAIYASLAAAYRQLGDPQRSSQALAVLSRLVQEQQARNR